MRPPDWLEITRTGTRWEFRGRVSTDGTTTTMEGRPVAVVYRVEVDPEFAAR